MDEEPEKAEFVSKSFTIIITLNVLLNICVFVLYVSFGEAEPPKHFYFLSYFVALWGFVSSIVLLIKAAKFTNLKILRYYIKAYFIAYVASIVFLAVFLGIVIFEASFSWWFIFCTITILLCFVVICLPFVLLGIVLWHFIARSPYISGVRKEKS